MPVHHTERYGPGGSSSNAGSPIARTNRGISPTYRRRCSR